jgi:hypothetical protein
MKMILMWAAFGVALASGTAAAATKPGNVLRCEAGSRAGVVTCCHEISGGRLPGWMAFSHTSCESQAFCAYRKGKQVCRIAPAQDMVDIDTLDPPVE